MRYDVNDMINRFATMWGEPKTDDVDRYLHEYHRALNGTDPDLLEAATTACIDSETYWPKVAIVKKQVELASARRASRAPPAERSGYSGPRKFFPSIIVRRGDMGWNDWMREIGMRSGPDVRAAFEAEEAIDVQARWPRPDVPFPRIVGEGAAPDIGSPNYEPPPPTPEMKDRVAEMLAQGKAALQAMDDPVEAKPNYWRDVTKSAFEDMQRNSLNGKLHRRGSDA